MVLVVCTSSDDAFSMKFHENIFKGFQDIERTWFCNTDGWTDGQQLWFLSSVCPLMMLYISMKFHENVLSSFQVIEQTQNNHCQNSKGNKSKNELASVTVLWSARYLMMLCISMKFHDTILSDV